MLGDIARTIRILPAKSTGVSPYLLVFRQSPPLSLNEELRAFTVEELEASQETFETDIEYEVGIWLDMFTEIRERHRKYDASMVAQYLRRRDLAEQDIRFVFHPGDRVLLK